MISSSTETLSKENDVPQSVFDMEIFFCPFNEIERSIGTATSSRTTKTSKHDHCKKES